MVVSFFLLLHFFSNIELLIFLLLPTLMSIMVMPKDDITIFGRPICLFWFTPIYLQNFGFMRFPLLCILLIGCPIKILKICLLPKSCFKNLPLIFIYNLLVVCYPWISPYTNSKLDHRYVPCIFLSYLPTQSGFRCYDPVADKFYLFRHVMFKNNSFPFSTLVSHPSSTNSTSTHELNPSHIAAPIKPCPLCYLYPLTCTIRLQLLKSHPCHCVVQLQKLFPHKVGSLSHFSLLLFFHLICHRVLLLVTSWMWNRCLLSQVLHNYLPRNMECVHGLKTTFTNHVNFKIFQWPPIINYPILLSLI